MADFINDNLGYKLADCVCGGKPELMSMPVVRAINQRVYLYFTVQCTNCGRTSGMHADEADAVYFWNRYMKNRGDDEFES